MGLDVATRVLVTKELKGRYDRGSKWERTAVGVRRKTGTARAQTAAMYRSKTKINKLATKRHLQMSQRIKPAGHLDMSQQDRLWDPSDLICARFSPRRE